jgi:hypothetical protein
MDTKEISERLEAIKKHSSKGMFDVLVFDFLCSLADNEVKNISESAKLFVEFDMDDL